MNFVIDKYILDYKGDIPYIVVYKSGDWYMGVDKEYSYFFNRNCKSASLFEIINLCKKINCETIRYCYELNKNTKAFISKNYSLENFTLLYDEQYFFKIKILSSLIGDE